MLDPVRKTVYQNLLKSAVILEMGDLSAQNKRQVSDLFAGVVRMQRLLDFYIDHLVAKKANIKVQTLLRMAMYELTQTQIPPYALVSEYVNLAKKYQPKAASFVNAILRKASKTHFELPKEWGILYSHPNWLIKRWIKSYGEVATEALLQWNNARPKHTLRINTLKTDIQTYKKQLDDVDIFLQYGLLAKAQEVLWSSAQC